LEEKADSFSTEGDSVAGDFLFGGSSDKASDDIEEAKDDGAFTSNTAGATTAATIVVLAWPRQPSVAGLPAYTGGRL
jgi:hypothetical protein